jgi:hypothetical protein
MKRLTKNKDRVFYGQLEAEWLRLTTVPADLYYSNSLLQKMQNVNKTRGINYENL